MFIYMKQYTSFLSRAVVVGVTLLFAGAACAANQQATIQNSPVVGTEENKVMMKSDADGVMMKDGKMMLQETGSVMMMKEDMVMSDGTRVMMDGKVMMSNGTEVMMKEGDTMMMKDGKMTMQENVMVKTETGTVDVSVNADAGAVVGKQLAASTAGSYENYDAEKLQLTNSGDVVLFFSASWCPACREADANFKTGSIPSNLKILKVDYDTSAELKKKYGVTYQHTFVQVDANGNLIKKWSGSATAAAVAGEVN